MALLDTFPVLRGPYLADLLAQPRAVADTVAGLRTLRLPAFADAFDRVVLTGMGSSLHGLHPLNLRLVAAGRTSVMVETAELIYAQPRLLEGRTLVVAVSQSGQSGETVSLLNLLDKQPTRPTVIGVTNTADSDLARRADAVVPLAAGPEHSVSCKTYLSTLVALDWLASHLLGENTAVAAEALMPASGLIENYLADVERHVADLNGLLRGVRHLFLVGRGRSLAAVGTGALILKESTRTAVEGMSSPSFRHGPLEMTSPELTALVFAGDDSTRPLNERLADDIHAAGGRAELVGVGGRGAFALPDAPPRLLPVLEMLPVQMASLAIAASLGREPGVFERASKITATE